MAPWGLHKNFSQCHASVWIGLVGNGNIDFEMVGCNADDGNGCNVVEVLVVGSDEVAVGFDAYNRNHSAEGELYVSKVRCQFSEKLRKELAE